MCVLAVSARADGGVLVALSSPDAVDVLRPLADAAQNNLTAEDRTDIL